MPALWLLALAFAVGFVLVAVRLLAGLFAFRGADTSGIPLPPPPASVRPTWKKAPAPAPAAAPDPAWPEAGWREAETVLAAATLLLRHGDTEEAIRLLRHDAAGTGAARALGRSVYARTRAVLGETVPLELARFRQFWDACPEAERAALVFGPAAAAALTERLGSIPVEADLQLMRSVLPAPLFLCFLAGVTRTVTAETGFPDVVVRLLIRRQLPASDLAARLLPASAEPELPAYAAAVPAWNAAFDRIFLYPEARRFWSGLRQRLDTASPVLADWYRENCGPRFCDELGARPIAAAPGSDLNRLWGHATAAVRALWSREFHAAAVTANALTLPPSLAAAHPWLRDRSVALDITVLQRICRHPEWRQALRSFRYEAALQRLPRLVRDLGGAAELTWFEEQLRRTLRAEQRLLSNPDFSWTRLRRNLGLLEAPVPAALRAGSGRRPSSGSGAVAPAPGWSTVNTARFYAAVLVMAESADTAAAADYYRRAARLYGFNRGVPMVRSEAEQLTGSAAE